MCDYEVFWRAGDDAHSVAIFDALGGDREGPGRGARRAVAQPI
jgi:hypothetical protein